MDSIPTVSYTHLLNPNVRKPIMEIFGADHSLLYPNVYLIEPLDYLPFVYLMDHFIEKNDVLMSI